MVWILYTVTEGWEKKEAGGQSFIKKLEQNEVHDCEDGGYLWPMDPNQTAPNMIR